MRKSIEKVVKGLRPAALGIPAARIVLRRVEDEQSFRSTNFASRLLSLTAPPPCMVRLAEPRECRGLDALQPPQTRVQVMCSALLLGSKECGMGSFTRSPAPVS